MKSYALGLNRLLLVSFDADGNVFERYEGPRWLVTDMKIRIMTENLAQALGPDAPPIRLVKG